MSKTVPFQIIQFSISSLCHIETVSRCLDRWLEHLKIGGKIETIRNTTLLRLARILRRILEIWRDLLSHRVQQKNRKKYNNHCNSRMQVRFVMRMEIPTVKIVLTSEPVVPYPWYGYTKRTYNVHYSYIYIYIYIYIT